jgi:hypothetical protein
MEFIFSPRSDAMNSFRMAAEWISLTKLFRMNQALGFGRSSRTAIGREAASGEDRRGHLI